MKVNKIRCDVCGKVIKEDHPTRFAMQNHKERTRYAAYVTEQKFDVCKDCINTVKEMFNANEKVEE